MKLIIVFAAVATAMAINDPRALQDRACIGTYCACFCKNSHEGACADC